MQLQLNQSDLHPLLGSLPPFPSPNHPGDTDCQFQFVALSNNGINEIENLRSCSSFPHPFIKKNVFSDSFRKAQDSTMSNKKLKVAQPKPGADFRENCHFVKWFLFWQVSWRGGAEGSATPTGRTPFKLNHTFASFRRRDRMPKKKKKIIYLSIQI